MAGDDRDMKGTTVDNDWQASCMELWGPDWIAPLSEVLEINRRTVERWRSGAVAIPEQVVDRIVHLGVNALNRRAYGTVLRRHANGESPEQIRDDAIAIIEATAQLAARLREQEGRSILRKSRPSFE